MKVTGFYDHSGSGVVVEIVAQPIDVMVKNCRWSSECEHNNWITKPVEEHHVLHPLTHSFVSISNN